MQVTIDMPSWLAALLIVLTASLVVGLLRARSDWDD